MTLPSSLNSGCVKALASFTASLIAEIPIFIFLFYRKWTMTPAGVFKEIDDKFYKLSRRFAARICSILPLKSFLHLSNVSRDLLVQFFGRTEFFLIAQF